MAIYASAALTLACCFKFSAQNHLIRAAVWTRMVAITANNHNLHMLPLSIVITFYELKKWDWKKVKQSKAKVLFKKELF